MYQILTSARLEAPRRPLCPACQIVVTEGELCDECAAQLPRVEERNETAYFSPTDGWIV